MKAIDTHPQAILPDPSEGGDAAPQPPRKRPPVRRIVLLCLLAAVIIAGGVGIYRLFFTQEELIPVTGTTTYGTLNDAIEGSGTTTPADSVTYTVSGTVLEWNVEAGDSVEEGDLLYVLDSSEAEDQILEYEVELEELYEQLSQLQENIASQRTAAPFSGRVESIQAETGDQVQTGTVLATLVDDSAMTATLYFSYSYRDAISKGMTVQVSIPDQMMECTGTVTDIQYVDYRTTEGLQCFAVTVSVENPGSLTEGTAATCWLTGSDGSPIYAATDAQLAYRASAQITAGAAGEVTGVNVVDYQRVSAGDTLFTIDASGYETQLETVQKQIDNAEENIAQLQESIDTEYTRYADISGQVVSASYTTDRMTGEDVGTVVIYNQDSMQIDINVDELNADYLEVGMPVYVYRTTSSSTVSYDAELTHLSLEATSSGSGVSTFAATITIDSQGELSSGVTVYYSIDTSGSTDGSAPEETVLAPLDALCTYDDGYYLLIQADSRPENAIDPAQSGGSVTDYPDGYYAVPVEVGDYNGSYIQILSGAEEGATLFLRYQNAAPTGGDSTSDMEQEVQEGGSFPEGEMPGGDSFPGGGSFPGGSGGMSGMGNMSGGMNRGG